MAIQSFSNEATELFFKTGRVKKVGWGNVKAIVARKLDMLDYAALLSDLRSPPGNKLEALTRDRIGYHSIRVNDQWRIVFRWTERGPADVEVVDYH